MQKTDFCSISCFVINVLLWMLATTTQCNGSITDAAMFEIPASYRTRFLLMDCKAPETHIKCKCKYLGKECQEADMKSCKNCRCLRERNRAFYIRRRYGAVCWSSNDLLNAAGFGQTFLVYHKPSKICARVGGIYNRYIYYTKACNAIDLGQVWIWTPGDLLLNALTLKCLDVYPTVKDYRSIFVSPCNSSVHTQKWKCNDRFWFGISSNEHSTNLTHAMRYYYRSSSLLARTVKLINKGNLWTIYPGGNQSVCEARSPSGYFYLKENETGISQIDLFPNCPMATNRCSRLLHSSLNVRNLSNCKILWEESSWLTFKRGWNVFSNQSKPPFVLDRNKDGIYFTWMSDPYSPLAGTSVNLTIECLSEGSKFQEYSFAFRVKDIRHKTVPGCYQFIKNNELPMEFNVPVLDLSNDCVNSSCSRQFEAPLKLNRSLAVCTILWNESTLTRNGRSWMGIENTTKVFSINNVNRSRRLVWNLIKNSLFNETKFNLTIFCYDDHNENYTVAETSCLAFRIDFNTEKFEEISAEKSDILVIILPVVLSSILLLLVLLITCHLKRRTRRSQKNKRMEVISSTVSLQGHLESQCSHEVRDMAFRFPKHGNEIKEDENHRYQECTSTAHPVVTIARNKLYEYTIPCTLPGPDSGTYEKPIQLQSVKRPGKAFEGNKSAKSDNSPKKRPDLLPQKPNKENKVDLVEPEYYSSVSSEIENGVQEVYDNPLDFIPSHGNEDFVSSAAAFLSDNVDNRPTSHYDNPLPRTPEETYSDVYDYATREEMLKSGTSNLSRAEKPLDTTLEKGFPSFKNPGRDKLDYYENVNGCASSGLPNDAPLYDVLDHGDGRY